MDTRKLFAIERLLKQKIARHQVPDVKDVVVIQKKRLIERIGESIDAGGLEKFLELATELSAEKDMIQVLAAVLKDAYEKRFDESSYSSIQERGPSISPT